MSDPEKVWLPVEHAPSSRGMPTSAMFDDANGGEYRKSLHIYAPPFAQLVESPSKINGIAMQIDTWHRWAPEIELLSDPRNEAKHELSRLKWGVRNVCHRIVLPREPNTPF